MLESAVAHREPRWTFVRAADGEQVLASFWAFKLRDFVNGEHRYAHRGKELCEHVENLVCVPRDEMDDLMLERAKAAVSEGKGRCWVGMELVPQEGKRPRFVQPMISGVGETHHTALAIGLASTILVEWVYGRKPDGGFEASLALDGPWMDAYASFRADVVRMEQRQEEMIGLECRRLLFKERERADYVRAATRALADIAGPRLAGSKRARRSREYLAEAEAAARAVMAGAAPASAEAGGELCQDMGGSPAKKHAPEAEASGASVEAAAEAASFAVAAWETDVAAASAAAAQAVAASAAPSAGAVMDRFLAAQVGPPALDNDEDAAALEAAAEEAATATLAAAQVAPPALDNEEDAAALAAAAEGAAAEETAAAATLAAAEEEEEAAAALAAAALADVSSDEEEEEAPSPEVVLIDDDEVFEVKKVLQTVYGADGDPLRFLVSWVGYPPSENSWVQASDLLSTPAAFCAQHGVPPTKP